jgi:uncharacterized integral membrane protein
MKILTALLLWTLISGTTLAHTYTYRYETPETAAINGIASQLSLSTSKTILIALFAGCYGGYIGCNIEELSKNKNKKSRWIAALGGIGCASLLALISKVDETYSIETQDYIKQLAAIPLAQIALATALVGSLKTYEFFKYMYETIKKNIAHQNTLAG